MPKITNDHNLPEYLYHAIKHFAGMHKQGSGYSVTELTQPAQKTILERKYKDRLVIDAYDLLDIFLGQCVHFAIETANKEHDRYEVEQFMSMFITSQSGTAVEITGSLDVWDDLDNAIDDTKVTKAYKVIYGKRDGNKDYIEKLNLYRLLFSETHPDYKVPEKLRNLLLLKDWNKRDLNRDGSGDYPEEKFAVMEQQVWDLSEARAFLQQKVDALETAKDFKDENLPKCTSEEMWNNRLRCKQFCMAAPFCAQFKAYNKPKEKEKAA